MNYESTINALFAQLATANAADSDNSQRWQRADDANQRAGFYGHLRAAIVAIAGEAIVEYWAATNEVDLKLANRNPETMTIDTAKETLLSEGLGMHVDRDKLACQFQWGEPSIAIVGGTVRSCEVFAFARKYA